MSRDFQTRLSEVVKPKAHEISDCHSLFAEIPLDGMPSPPREEAVPDSNLSIRTHRLSEKDERAFRFGDLSRYSLKDRLLIRVAGLLFFAVVTLIGKTIRFEVKHLGEGQSSAAPDRTPIYASWHNRNFISTYFWRRRGIVALTSQSFDGEYIARLIQRFGYGAARGSSTRGAVGAFVEMARLVRAGYPAGVTVDGPRGPRYVVKMGAVVLAKRTRQPILPFVITAARYWELKSWDRFQVPKPFTRANVVIAAPIDVPANADDAELEARRNELQRALEALTQKGEQWRSSIS